MKNDILTFEEIKESFRVSDDLDYLRSKIFTSLGFPNKTAYLTEHERVTDEGNKEIFLSVTPSDELKGLPAGKLISIIGYTDGIDTKDAVSSFMKERYNISDDLKMITLKEREKKNKQISINFDIKDLP